MTSGKEIIWMLSVLFLLHSGTCAFTFLSGRFKMNCTLSPDKTNIMFRITAQTTGWVGLGFTPGSDMRNAELVIGAVSNGVGSVGMYSSTRNGMPNKITSTLLHADARVHKF
jgi:hypothetical protein